MNVPLSIMTDDEVSRCLPAGEEDGFGSLQTERGPLPLKAMDVRVSLEGLLGQLELCETFVNTFDEPLEATYIFPLPDRAALTKFRMDVANRVVEGVLQERGEARRAYDQAMAQGHRAAIAEEERPGVFTLRVGNIMPGEQARIRLSLSMPLVYDAGEVTFRFPLVVAPRYIPGNPLSGDSVGAGTAVDTDAVPDASRISPPILLPGYPNPVQLSLTVDLFPGQFHPRNFRSSLHSVFMQRDEAGKYRFALQPGERLNRDFILRYELGEEAVQTSLDLMPDSSDTSQGTFVLTLLPPNTQHCQQKRRDVVFVLDRSGSMSGWKMVAARRAVAHMVDTLTEQDRFTIYAFDNTVETPPLFGGSRLVPATNRNRYRAIEFLQHVDSRGGTEMAQPLSQAVTQLQSDRDCVMVLITDGQVGNEDQILRTLANRLDNIRIFTLGIDQAVNEGFLRRLAQLGGGSCDVVESENRLDEVMYKVHRRIGSPMLSDVRVDFSGLEVERDTVVPNQKLDLFAGVPLTITGRYRGAAAGSIAVDAVDEAGRPWSRTVTARCSYHPAAAVVWARQRIREWEDQFVTDARNRAEIERQIIQTSLRFNVLCRFTAFVSVDKSEVANEGGQQHRIIQAVEAPAGWEMLQADAMATRSLGSYAFAGAVVESSLTDYDDACEDTGVDLMVMPCQTPEQEKPPAGAARDWKASLRAKASRAAPEKRSAPGFMSMPEKSKSSGILGRMVNAVFRRGDKTEERLAARDGAADLRAYQERAKELLKKLRAADDSSLEKRLHALGILAVKLRELLDDMRSIDVAAETLAPLQQLTEKLEKLPQVGQPRTEDVDHVWQEVVKQLQEFAGQKIGTA